MNSQRIVADASFHIKHNRDFSIDPNVYFDKPIRLTLKFTKKDDRGNTHASTQNFPNEKKNTFPAFYFSIHLSDALFVRGQSVATCQ